MAWTFSTGLNRGHEGTPLVVGHTMYVVTPYPNIVYALDLRNPTGPLKWKYRPPTDPAAQGKACCDVVNRGASWVMTKLRSISPFWIRSSSGPVVPPRVSRYRNVKLGPCISAYPVALP